MKTGIPPTRTLLSVPAVLIRKYGGSKGIRTPLHSRSDDAGLRSADQTGPIERPGEPGRVRATASAKAQPVLALADRLAALPALPGLLGLLPVLWKLLAERLAQRLPELQERQ